MPTVVGQRRSGQFLYKLTVPTNWQVFKRDKCLSKTGRVRVNGTTERKISLYAILSGWKLSRYNWRSDWRCTSYIHVCSYYCLTVIVSSYINVPSIHLVAGE
jgi:hypothetical protein